MPRKQLANIDEEDQHSEYLPESEMAKKMKSSRKSSASDSMNQIANSRFSSKSREAPVIHLDDEAEEEDLVEPSSHTESENEEIQEVVLAPEDPVVEDVSREAMI